METKYPKSVNVDFRKLEKPALLKILKHYKVEANPDAAQLDLATLAARAFEATVVSEDLAVGSFLEQKCGIKQDMTAMVGRKRAASSRDILDSEPAIPGEQVAANMTKSGEDGCWIIGNVLQFDPRTSHYLVQDEDDPNRVVTLPPDYVRRLEDTAEHLRRGDEVMAVFPETTSFYRAVIAKNPKPPLNSNTQWEVVVRFEDDEDENGNVPPRRVPARFVLRRSLIEGDGDDMDTDDDPY
eukprot:gene31006-37473_t